MNYIKSNWISISSVLKLENEILALKNKNSIMTDAEFEILYEKIKSHTANNADNDFYVKELHLRKKLDDSQYARYVNGDYEERQWILQLSKTLGALYLFERALSV